MSMPFYGEEFTFTQPDGSEIKVKGWGDQHHAVFETLDGYTVVKDPHTGYFTYADVSSDGEDLRSTGAPVGAALPRGMGLDRGLRVAPHVARERAHGAYRLMGLKRRWEVRRERAKAVLRSAVRGGPVAAPPQQHTVGSYVGLCLLIQFPDVAGTIATNEVASFCNQQGYTGYGNNGSVFDYFYDNSGGRLEYTNIVTAYYTAQHPRAYYTDPRIEIGIRARELIKEALDHLKQTGFDFSRLSADDGGYVYAMNIFYAGPRVNNWMEGLWPHSWSLAAPYPLAPGRHGFDYQVTNIGSELSLSTFCHENGHMVCDFPDLYDYGYESSGIGNYCLMVSGGRDPKNPVQICGYLKYKAGWADTVTPVTSGMQASVMAGRNDFFLLSRSRTEYFLVENRQRNGRDSALPSAGLAIWHVDELGSNNYEHMTEAQHYECALEQADSRFDLERGANQGDFTDLFNHSNSGRFSDATSPSSAWWDGTASGLDLHDIGPVGTEMSFRATLFGDDGNQQAYHASSAPGAAIPDNTAGGVEDALSFVDSALVSAVTVRVDITHSYRGDLRVSLVSPSGTIVILHNRNGGGTDNLSGEFDVSNTPGLTAFAGEQLRGDWTLRVEDLAAADLGSLQSWEMQVEAVAEGGGGTSAAVIELVDEPGQRIPDNDPAGIARALTVDTAGVVHEISVGLDITHTYIGDLKVTLTSPAGKTVDLHQRSGGSSDNIEQVYTPFNTPDLTLLAGEAVTGNWTLNVVDSAGMDIGKLNAWSLRITRA